jgi:hypothetical protein
MGSEGGRAEGQKGGWADGLMGGRADGQTGARPDGRTGGPADGRWEDGRTGGRTDGRGTAGGAHSSLFGSQIYEYDQTPERKCSNKTGRVFHRTNTKSCGCSVVH